MLADSNDITIKAKSRKYGGIFTVNVEKMNGDFGKTGLYNWSISKLKVSRFICLFQFSGSCTFYTPFDIHKQIDIMFRITNSTLIDRIDPIDKIDHK